MTLFPPINVCLLFTILIALMEQDFRMIEFALQPPHDGVTDLIAIAHGDHDLAFGGDHRQAQAQMGACRGWRAIQPLKLVCGRVAQLGDRFDFAGSVGR